MAATFQENQNNPSKSTQVKRNLPESMKVFLLEKAAEYEDRSFIEDDPIAIPHRYSKTDDIELAGFLTASLAWGNRKSILKSADALMGRMDHEPAAFLREASDVELQQAVKGFVHRTFQERDAALFFVALRGILKRYGSLEAVFVEGHRQSTETDKSAMADAIGHFHRVFFELAAAGGMPADRTRKHVAQPQKGSAAKRLNMYTRVDGASRHAGSGLWCLEGLVTGRFDDTIGCPYGQCGEEVGADRPQGQRLADGRIDDASPAASGSDRSRSDGLCPFRFGGHRRILMNCGESRKWAAVNGGAFFAQRFMT
jgi:uncharacterized protein (TIGR02757 family)